MGKWIVAILAAVAGAALFHAYYLNLPDDRRCRWDHPFGDADAALCAHPAADDRVGYSAHDRKQLDSLIDNVAD